MIGKWLATPADIARLEARVGAVEGDLTPPQSIRGLEDRIAAIERELPSVVSLATGLGAEMRRIDERSAITALEIARLGRRIEALRRLVRLGGAKADAAIASAAAHTSAPHATDEALGRLRASLAIVEHRIETEAEQTRRGVSGLFERIETLRRALAPDREPDPAAD